MITIAIPTFNRTTLLYESFAQVLEDPRISEVVIVDDASEYLTYEEIVIKFEGHSKVKIFRNDKNFDCYRNKREAVSKATNDLVILLDSDNIITPEYMDSFVDRDISGGLMMAGFRSTILQPSFAKPHFDFRQFEGAEITRKNVHQYMHVTNFETMLNACNFVMHRDEYLRVWDGSIDPVTSDSIYFNYKWIEAGNSIYVVPNMHYTHRVHDGSHYKNNNKRTPRGFHESIVEKLKAMR